MHAKERTTWDLKSANDMKTFIGSQVVNTSAEWAEQVEKVGDNGLIMFGHFEGTTPEVHCARARA